MTYSAAPRRGRPPKTPDPDVSHILSEVDRTDPQPDIERAPTIPSMAYPLPKAAPVPVPEPVPEPIPAGSPAASPEMVPLEPVGAVALGEAYLVGLMGASVLRRNGRVSHHGPGSRLRFKQQPQHVDGQITRIDLDPNFAWSESVVRGFPIDDDVVVLHYG